MFKTQKLHIVFKKTSILTKKKKKNLQRVHGKWVRMQRYEHFFRPNDGIEVKIPKKCIVIVTNLIPRTPLLGI